MAGAVIHGEIEDGSPLAGRWVAGVARQRSMAENSLVDQANGALIARYRMEIAE